MAVIVSEEAGGTILTTASEQTIGAAIAAQGVFFLRLDLASGPLTAGATPDIIEVYEYVKARSGGTQRLMEGSPYTYVGGLSPSLVETPHRAVPASCSLEYKIKRIQGTDRTFAYAVIEIG